MHGCDSWIIKKAEHQKIDAFKLWCWKLLRIPWTARRLNPVNPKEINPKYSLEGQMLKLKFQYFGHLMWTDSLEKALMLGKTEGKREGDDREWDGWMASLTQWTWVWENSGRQWRTGKSGSCSPWGCKELDMTEWLNNKMILNEWTSWYNPLPLSVGKA